MTWTITDMFCGAGGSSQGAERVPGVRLRMGANHWKQAIRTHAHNFPHADHECADISQVTPSRFPRTHILLASPECTNHSMAKSHKSDLFDPKGDPAAERSRATMWDVPRFAEYHSYDCIVVENVTEVRRWAMFPAWLQAMTLLGYDYELLYLNSMMFDVPQSRDRFYGVFWKRGMTRPNLDFRPLAHCVEHGDVEARQTWKKPNDIGGRYKAQYTYNCPWCAKPAAPYALPAAAAIDWSLLGQRIGDRTKPLSANTMRRIRLGLERFGPAIIQRFGNTFERKDAAAQYARAWSALGQPVPTQMTDLQHGLVTPLHHGAGGPGLRSTDEVWPTQTARAENGLVQFSPFIAELRGGSSAARGVDEPLATLCASGNHHGVVTPGGFMVKNYGDGTDPSMSFPFHRPLGAVTTMDHHSVVRFPGADPDAFVQSYYGNGTCSPVRQPLPTVRTHDSAALINPGIDVEDCLFRMLEPPEVQAAMAFARDYHLVGNKREKVKQLGNGVTPPVMTRIVGRLVEALESRVAA